MRDTIESTVTTLTHTRKHFMPLEMVLTSDFSWLPIGLESRTADQQRCPTMSLDYTQHGGRAGDILSL